MTTDPLLVSLDVVRYSRQEHALLPHHMEELFSLLYTFAEPVRAGHILPTGDGANIAWSSPDGREGPAVEEVPGILQSLLGQLEKWSERTRLDVRVGIHSSKLDTI